MKEPSVKELSIFSAWENYKDSDGNCSLDSCEHEIYMTAYRKGFAEASKQLLPVLDFYSGPWETKYDRSFAFVRNVGSVKEFEYVHAKARFESERIRFLL